tara:strand:+ start:45 stop:368 length:324 start_codon:yes stop_codon:yes gene_type:complete
MANLEIDGKLYEMDTLPQEAKGQLAALQQCEQKINSWNMNIAIAQTARGAYAAELKLLLEQVAVVDAEKVEVVEAEEVDEVDEVEILSADEVEGVEVLEAEAVEANR